MKNKCIYGLLVGAMMAGACPVWGETVVGETVSPSDSIKLVVVSDNDALWKNRLWELPLRWAIFQRD